LEAFFRARSDWAEYISQMFDTGKCETLHMRLARIELN
jgi:hypothetical protein